MDVAYPHQHRDIGLVRMVCQGVLEEKYHARFALGYARGYLSIASHGT